ncbi:uncharacterized protein [Salminus brasiliensis]|uniref:uncharacterized protein isoform X4 n=1 Tax=Salminus brasiliensis TaxID=930266 RepID=UPI003B82CD39
MATPPSAVALTRENGLLGHKTAMERGRRTRGYQLTWQGRTPLPSSPGPARGVSLERDTDKDFLITQLIQKIEALQLSKGVSAAKVSESFIKQEFHCPFGT